MPNDSNWHYRAVCVNCGHHHRMSTNSLFLSVTEGCCPECGTEVERRRLAPIWGKPFVAKVMRWRKTGWFRGTWETKVEGTDASGSALDILGVRFRLCQEKTGVFLQQVDWPSLSAHGTTLEEATFRAMRNIKIAIDEYVNTTEELTEDGRAFRLFLIEREKK